MALKLSQAYSDVTAPNSAYPHGSAKNETTPGALDGTPFEKALIDDIQGLLQSLLVAASITPNESSDNVLTPQYLSAIFNLRYYNRVDYKVGARVVGSNGVVYIAKANNGPSTTIVNPVTEASPRSRWFTEKAIRFDEDNPVGTIRMSSDNANPGTTFGVGTWTQIKGRFIVGVDSNDPAFNTADETGGSKEHTHGTGNTELGPNNGQRVTVGRDSWGSIQSGGGLQEPSVFGRLVTGSGRTENSELLESLGHASANQTAYVIGDTTASNSLPPYVAKYIWERTA